MKDLSVRNIGGIVAERCKAVIDNVVMALPLYGAALR